MFSSLLLVHVVMVVPLHRRSSVPLPLFFQGAIEPLYILLLEHLAKQARALAGLLPTKPDPDLPPPRPSTQTMPTRDALPEIIDRPLRAQPKKLHKRGPLGPRGRTPATPAGPPSSVNALLGFQMEKQTPLRNRSDLERSVLSAVLQGSLPQQVDRLPSAKEQRLVQTPLLRDKPA